MRQYLDDFTTIKRRNIFNVETVNIFSDASYRKNGKGCFGAVMIYQNDPIAEITKTYQTDGETVNSLELKGIRTAIEMAYSAQAVLYSKYQKNIPISYINIFSDSKYSVTAIKNYIFNPNLDWEWNYQARAFVRHAKGRILQVIPNQDLIIEISNMILKFAALYPNIVFDLWWCPAHVETKYKREIKEAGQRFKMANCSRFKRKDITVDQDFMRYVCTSNHRIDNAVQRESKKYGEQPIISEPIKFYYGPGE